jgi:hypothetical protein
VLIAGLASCESPSQIDDQPARIVIIQMQAGLLKGDTIRLQTQVYDARDRLLPAAPVSWSAPDTLVTVVREDGLVYGRELGTATLSARSGVSEAHATVIVTEVTGGWQSLGTICGVWETNTTYCWLTDSAPPWSILPPVLLTGVPVLSRIRFGLQHACGIAANGDAYCWGENVYGQVGDGTMIDRPTPVPVAGGLLFDSITVGALHSCAITREGRAYCWGVGRRGQLGAPPPEVCAGFPCSTQPLAVAGNLRFRVIAAGGIDVAPSASGLGFTCAVTDVGKAYCWGGNFFGSVGDASRTDRSVPTAVASTESFVTIAAGEYHACALARGGEVHCWGGGSEGQHGSILPQSTGCPVGDIVFGCATTPLVIPDHRFRSLTAYNGNTCALDLFGAAFCWGRNNLLGQVGAGPIAENKVRTPRRVIGGHTFVEIRMGISSTCGLKPVRSVLCWGNFVPEPQLVPEPMPRR